MELSGSRPRQVAIVCNPCAGGGRALRLLPRLKAFLRGEGIAFQTALTNGPGDGALLASQLADACDLLVVVGGDGSLHNVVNGLPYDRQESLPVVVAPAGTGNSFARHFGVLPEQPLEGLRRAVGGTRQRVDAAQLTYADALTGEPRSRLMVNVFGCGFMARVAEDAQRRFARLGAGSYSLGVFSQLLDLAAVDTTLEIEDAAGVVSTWTEPLTLAAVCNTQYTAASMWIAPRADASDGLLDLVTLGRVSRPELVRLFPRIFSGTHLRHPSVRYQRVRRLRIVPTQSSPVLMDGELPGRTPVSLKAVPGALLLAM